MKVKLFAIYQNILVLTKYSVLQQARPCKCEVSESSTLYMMHSVVYYAEFTRRSLVPRRRMVSRHASKCDFIHARMKSTAVPAAILAKPTNAEEHYLQMVYTQFHPNRAKKV